MRENIEGEKLIFPEGTDRTTEDEKILTETERRIMAENEALSAFLTDRKIEATDYFYWREIESGVKEKIDNQKLPNPEDFINADCLDEKNKYLYTKEWVQHDKKELETIKKSFKKPNIWSQALEVIIYEQSEMGNWFELNSDKYPSIESYTAIASEYDDKKNGIDLVIEFNVDGEYIPLGVDVTWCGEEKLEEKIKRIKKNIMQGNLSEVKYLKSNCKNVKLPLKKIPRVVISVDKETMRDVADLWIRKNRCEKTETTARKKGQIPDSFKYKKNDEKNGKDVEINTGLPKSVWYQKALEKHPIQFYILQEIKLQLEAFKSYTVETIKDSKTKEEIKEIYNKVLKLINSILEDKKPEEGYGPAYSYLKNDLARLEEVLKLQKISP